MGAADHASRGSIGTEGGRRGALRRVLTRRALGHWQTSPALDSKPRGARYLDQGTSRWNSRAPARQGPSPEERHPVYLPSKILDTKSLTSVGFEPTPLARRGPEPRALDRSATMSLMTKTEQKLIQFANIYRLLRSSRGKQPLTRVSAIAKTPHAQPRATQRAPPNFSWYLRRPPRSARHRGPD